MTDVLPVRTELIGAANLSRSTVHLVRHGESTWNLQQLVQGQQSSPELTDLGRRQAAAAAAVLAGGKATRLLASDLTRAVQTADIIGGMIGLVSVVTPLLREQSLGSLEGGTTAAAAAALAGVDLSDPETPYGDGESRNDVLIRFQELLKSSAFTGAGPDDELVLVSHGDTIRIAIAHLLGDDPRTGPWRAVENGSVTTIRPGVLRAGTG